MSNEGIHRGVCSVPSHLLVCHYLDEPQCPLSIRDQQLTVPRLHIHPQYQLCMCVRVCACEFARLPAEPQLLPKCHHGLWDSPCCASHPHSRSAALSRHSVFNEYVDHHIMFVLNIEQKQSKVFPSLPPLCHLLSLSPSSISHHHCMYVTAP